MPGIIDLRSDTVTRPTPGMRAAMFAAEVGDDVFCDDPTVNLLQEKAAALLGREAALFLASGTMSNQVALKVLTQAGDEVLLAEGSHSYMYESGAASIIGALHLHVLPADRGRLSPEQIGANISPDDVHFAPTTCVSLENTHNRGGGSVYPLETIVRIRQAAQRHSLVMHLDGARLFNACAATGITAAEYARHFETVSFCLSKGLGAPVGSMLAGDRDTIKLARRWRKVMGGGMRQAGFLAAAGIYALDHHIDRLPEDHATAKFLARGLAGIAGLDINPEEVETNLVIFKAAPERISPQELCRRLAAKGVLALPVGPDKVRAVTHLDVCQADVERAVEMFSEVMSE